MERFESARSQMVEERRKIQMRVDVERRRVEEILDSTTAYIKDKKLCLYGKGKSSVFAEENVRRQLRGEM